MSHRHLPSVQLSLGKQAHRPPLKPLRAKSLPTSPSRSRRTSPRASPYPSPYALSPHLEDGFYVDLTDLDNFDAESAVMVSEPDEYFPRTACGIYDPEKQRGVQQRYEPIVIQEGPRGFFDVLMIVWTGIQVVFGCAMGLVAIAGGKRLRTRWITQLDPSKLIQNL